MDQQIKDKTLDQITKAESVLIAVSPSLGFDGLAAGLGLYLSLIKLDKNVSISANLPSVGDAQKLYAVDRIGKLEGVKNPVVVVENAVETIDKVTHYLEGTKLKLVLHPLPGTQQITKDQISIEYNSTPASLIFAIGFNSLHDLRTEITHEQEFNPESWIININNVQSNQKFAQVDIVNQNFSGISEVTAKLIQDLALPIDEDIAYNFYAGMRESTQNFMPSQIDQTTFEIAGWLVKFGAGKASFARNSSEKLSIPQSQGFSQQAAPQKRFAPQYNFTQNPDTLENRAGLEDAEIVKEQRIRENKNDWLKPPKVYKGSKSFDREN